MSYQPSFDPTAGSHESANLMIATSPDGLVSIGDMEAMRRFILLHAARDGDAQNPYRYGDAARQSLFDAANNAMVKSSTGVLMRLRLYAWPVTFTVDRKVLNAPRNLRLLSAKCKALGLKYRELWARAFQAKVGVAISPMAYAANLNGVLGISPVAVRECVRNGVAIYAGRPGSPWMLAEDDATEYFEADLPTTYLFCAYAGWELGAPEPTLHMDHALRGEIEALTQSVIAHSDRSKYRAHAQVPCLFHDAITTGQIGHYGAMYRRSRATGRSLNLSYELDGFTHSLTAAIFNGHDDDISITTRYSHLWRPMGHIQAIEQSINALQSAEYQAQSRVVNAFDGFVEFPGAKGGVH